MISLALGSQEDCDDHCNFIPMQELRIMVYRSDLLKVRHTCYLLLLRCYLYHFFLYKHLLLLSSEFLWLMIALYSSFNFHFSSVVYCLSTK